MLEIVVLSVYAALLTCILVYCVLESGLAVNYLRFKKPSTDDIPTLTDSQLPNVTIQLPVFNEMYVVERLIDSCISMDYPKEKLEIQVLDDSTDETVDISRNKVKFYKDAGYNISLITRTDRTGFKAGALQNGLEKCSGEFIAIFDADFIPDPQFLKRTVPYFKDEEIGVVQTRWGHINRDYSLLTRIQAFFLDAHFTVEQSGRNLSGYFINFNGTAGIWRKNTIQDAGGWKADTLTEDLDLSYRAQMKGWRFKYLEEFISPAELPADIKAFKSQQFRWIKGGAETAVKILPSIKKGSLPFSVKLNAFTHLLSSSVYLIIFLAVLISVPVLFLKNSYLEIEYTRYAWPFVFSTLAVAFVYYVACVWSSENKGRAFLDYIFLLPSFLIITLGLSFHNAVAVVRGFMGEKTPFIRTPKYNILNAKDKWADKQNYVMRKIDWVTMLEGVLCLYFMSALLFAVVKGDYSLFILHLIAVLGFGYVFVYSIGHSMMGAK